MNLDRLAFQFASCAPDADAQLAGDRSVEAHYIRECERRACPRGRTGTGKLVKPGTKTPQRSVSGDELQEQRLGGEAQPCRSELDRRHLTQNVWQVCELDAIEVAHGQMDLSRWIAKMTS